MKFKSKDRRKLVEAAMGKRELDLLIKNVRLVNVFTGEVYAAEIGIYDGFIAHVHADPDNEVLSKSDISAKEVFDGEGQYIMPGFIDPHMHIESTLMTPVNFTKAALPLGTTTVVTDPHEAANVLGLDAVRYMLEASEDLAMKHFVLAPSCVPSMPEVENSGANFDYNQIDTMLSWDRVLGVAELMDFPGIIHNSQRMTKIIDKTIEHNGFMQGHAPGIGGRELSAYICGGPESDHETYERDLVRERIRNGMYVDAKASTFMDNTSKIIPSVTDFPFFASNLTLCTDDREPDGILHEGHMNFVINTAIKAGLSPIKAITAATLNVAREMKFDNLGAITPGYVADLVIAARLEDIKPSAVFADGKLVAKNGQLTEEIKEVSNPIEKINTMNLDFPTIEMLKIESPIKEGLISTNIIVQDEKADVGYTRFEQEKISVTDGYLDISDKEKLNYVAVFNRHKGCDNYTLGLVRNFPLEKGCVGGTVAHDSHHLMIVYSDPKDAVIAAEELIRCGGGFICVEEEKVLGKVELPIMGLMSDLECEAIASKHETLTNVAKTLAGRFTTNPFMSMAVLSLPVYPAARITDEGLFDLNKMSLISLFE